MSKGKNKVVKERIRKQYDFSSGARGKYARRFAEGSNVVVLDPDVARLFPDAKSVNRALRAIAKVAPRPAADRGK